MSELENNRITQLQTLESILRLASGLNRGSGIVDKIQDLETMCEELDVHDYENPTPSFTHYIRELVIDDVNKNKTP